MSLAMAQFVVICAATIAEASEEKMIIMGERVVNPETGAEGRRILNPKGVVQLTFTSSGLQIQYETESGKVETVKLTADFPALAKEASSEGEKMYNDFMAQGLKDNGRAMAGHLMRNTAKGLAENGATMQVLFETSRPGFVITEYSYKEVIVFTPSGSLSLAQAVMNVLSADANKKVGEVMAARAAEAAAAQAATAKAEEPVVTQRNPIGFIWDTKGSAGAVRACEMLFRATGS